MTLISTAARNSSALACEETRLPANAMARDRVEAENSLLQPSLACDILVRLCTGCVAADTLLAAKDIFPVLPALATTSLCQATATPDCSLLATDGTDGC